MSRLLGSSQRSSLLLPEWTSPLSDLSSGGQVSGLSTRLCPTTFEEKHFGRGKDQGFEKWEWVKGFLLRNLEIFSFNCDIISLLLFIIFQCNLHKNLKWTSNNDVTHFWIPHIVMILILFLTSSSKAMIQFINYPLVYNSINRSSQELYHCCFLLFSSKHSVPQSNSSFNRYYDVNVKY